MPRMTHPIAALLLLAVIPSAVAAQTATREDFQAWQTLMEGRWVGDVTWIADWPGFGNKGDKVTAYIETVSIADGQGLMSRFHGGNGTAHWVAMYDAGAKEIRTAAVNSGGGTGTCVISREAQQWKARCSGSLADGTKTEADLTLHVSDNGNTYRWSGRETVGGKVTDPLQDVWRRVSQ